jgi:hypothetical protein
MATLLVLRMTRLWKADQQQGQHDGATLTQIPPPAAPRHLIQHQMPCITSSRAEPEMKADWIRPGQRLRLAVAEAVLVVGRCQRIADGQQVDDGGAHVHEGVGEEASRLEESVISQAISLPG